MKHVLIRAEQCYATSEIVVNIQIGRTSCSLLVCINKLHNIVATIIHIALNSLHMVSIRSDVRLRGHSYHNHLWLMSMSFRTDLAIEA